GAQRFYRDGSNHLAPRDSIILVNADQVHDGHSAAEGGWSYQAMYPTPELFDTIADELKGARSGLPYFSDPVVHDPYMANQTRQLFQVLHHSDSTLERETHLLHILAAIVQRHGKSRVQLNDLGHEPVSISRVREYLDVHFEENISIQTLAALVDLNPFYLTRLFKHVVGLPPHAYQVQRRVQRAKKLIQCQMPLAEVAVQCGFTDQSHLSRHFK
ncbi:MAG: AraC family transcriptional regulator, partial [Gammaproteobacteria bacterium]|nr:AraC family transcriptional regulator [Gammaproteobacteria bacterium]